MRLKAATEDFWRRDLFFPKAFTPVRRVDVIIIVLDSFIAVYLSTLIGCDFKNNSNKIFLFFSKDFEKVCGAEGRVQRQCRWRNIMIGGQFYVYSYLQLGYMYCIAVSYIVIISTVKNTTVSTTFVEYSNLQC